MPALLHRLPKQRSDAGFNATTLGPLTFSSRFCSGNMGRVERTGAGSPGQRSCLGQYTVWTSPDCAGQACAATSRTWWYFSVDGAPSGSVIVRVHIS